jgi:hypothetical protein
MMAELQAVAASIRAAVDIGKAAKSVSDFNNFAAAVADVNMKLIPVMAAAIASLEKQSQLTARVAELEAELRTIRAWDRDADRYRLHTFPQTGVHAYAPKDPPKGNEQTHYLCATCFDKKQRSVLQPTGPRREFLKCNTCDKTIQIGKVLPLPYPPSGVV